MTRPTPDKRKGNRFIFTRAHYTSNLRMTHNSYDSFYFGVFVAQNERKQVNICEARRERQTAGNKLKHDCFCKITGKLS